MQAIELVEARPNARPLGYVGYSEVVGGQKIDYVIPGSHSEDQKVPGSARIVGVGAMRSYATSDLAIRAWWYAVATARPGLEDARMRCFRVSGGAVPGSVALWRGGRTEFSISTYASYVERDYRREVRKSAVVITSIRREGVLASLWERWITDADGSDQPRRISMPCPVAAGVQTTNE